MANLKVENLKANIENIIWLLSIVKVIQQMIDDGLEEIDWRSYVEIIEMIINGEYDYGLIKGENGYCVYPAGFVYEFYIIYYLTFRGSPTISLFLYMIFYFIMLYVIYKIYDSVLPKEYRWIKIFVVFSTPIQRAMINHRFNDGLAMIPLYICLYILINNQKKGLYYATFFYSFALSTKPNILLFLPGFLYVVTKIRGPLFGIIQLMFIILFQLLIGYPFIRVNSGEYFGKIFDFSREFLYPETMNWRFVPLEIFHSQFFYNLLMGVHLALLLIFLLFKWEKISFNLLKDVRLNDWSWEMKVIPMNKIFLLRVMFICNFIGVFCFRSLHYQFILWFFPSLPFLIWQTRLNDILKVAAIFFYTNGWSFRKEVWRSQMIFAIHSILFILLLCFDQPCDKKDTEIEQENNHEADETEIKKLK